ncbi:MAG: hypothetical protein ABIF19_12965 [Planctomycetota bacterium]
MPIKDQPSVFLSCIALVVIFIFFIEPLGSLAQNQQGLGPGGRRLTKPDPPSSSTGFGPNTGFGAGSSSSSSGSTGTRCVSIQCADGTVVPCNSSCPRPSASPSSPSSPSTSGAGGYAGPQSGPAQPSGPSQTDSWREEQARREAEERQRREEFEKSKQSALKELKGVESTEIALKGFEKEGELGLKDATDGSALKDINSDPSVVDLRDKKKPYALDLTVVKGANPQLLKELLGNFSETVTRRTTRSNEQAQKILRSFKTGEPPNPVKNISSLAPGDVILVAPVPMKARLEEETEEHLKDVMISNGINFLDRWGSDNWTSPASHAAIFLGTRNGKNWYLDNTGVGPVIKDEEQFLKQYGQRRMDVATLVGQPLSQHEGQELWKGAHELRNTTSYGIRVLAHDGNDAMVCSEAARWLLVRAGRRVTETRNQNRTIAGIDTGLNKKMFVNFSPSDFYEEQQYFVIHKLGMGKQAQ